MHPIIQITYLKLWTLNHFPGITQPENGGLEFKFSSADPKAHILTNVSIGESKSPL